jgi:hypothetical protein
MTRSLVLAVLLAIGALAPAQVSASRLQTIVHDTRHKGASSSNTSTNWSGYDITGSGATHVIGTWTQPAVTCSAGENSWSSPWVGLDGDTSNTVEQTGTDSDCSGGRPTYYAWYEMYPKGTVQITSLRVQPGDSFTGEVTNSSGTFVLSLTNNSSGQHFSIAIAEKRASLASAEWIMEGPSKGTLSNFGTVSFTGTSATINGQTGPVGSFATANAITMVTSSGTPRATPSPVSGKTSFSVTWQRS